MFESFATDAAPRLRAALVAAYGPTVGADAAAEALAYGWENWERVRQMSNPAGYLYRVGQSKVQRKGPKQGYLPAPPPSELPSFEPGLLPALEELTDLQRICVSMVHGYGWSLTETAEVLDIDISTVRTHIARALTKLKSALEVDRHV